VSSAFLSHTEWIDNSGFTPSNCPANLKDVQGEKKAEGLIRWYTSLCCISGLPGLLFKECPFFLFLGSTFRYWYF